MWKGVGVGVNLLGLHVKKGGSSFGSNVKTPTSGTKRGSRPHGHVPNI